MQNSGGWKPSNIKPGGWIIILLLIGCVYYLAHRSSLGALHFSMPPIPPLPGGSATLPAGQPQTGDILILTTGTKQAWLSEEIDKFNQQYPNYHAEMDLLESREGMQKILAGAEQPDIWSPSSSIWTDRLATIGPSKGIHIHSDNDDFRTLLVSPLVFLVVKDDMSDLRPILSGRHPFDTLSKLNQYKFAYADPLNASSGMLTMSLLLNEYADIHNVDDLDSVANSPGFASWLQRVDGGLLRRDTQGSSSLEKSFESDPGQRAFITAYESNAFAAVQNNSNLAIVYPDPTASATQVAAVVDGPWMTDARRQGAKQFLDFITSESAINDAVGFYFRPISNGGAILGQKIAASQAGYDYFKSDLRTVDQPSYDAINDANVLWHNQAP